MAAAPFLAPKLMVFDGDIAASMPVILRAAFEALAPNKAAKAPAFTAADAFAAAMFAGCLIPLKISRHSSSCSSLESVLKMLESSHHRLLLTMHTLLQLLLPIIFFAATAQAASTAQTGMHQAAETFLLEQSATLPGKVSIEIGKLPEAERYAACQNWQAFLPAGARAWGRVSLGLRCTDGGNFSFYVMAKVRVEGSYLAAARALANGQTISAADIKTVQGELSAQAADVLVSEAEAIGQTARTSIAAERPLQAILLRPTNIIQAGERVKVIAQTGGLTVSGEAQALGAAGAGQTLRVRLANGNVVGAIAREKGLVEVGY